MLSLQKSTSQLQLQQICYTQLPEKDKLARIAELYANAFAGDPWNEYKVCQNGHYFGLKQSELTSCTNCREPLKIAYPEEETVAYITKELTRQNGTLITFEDKNGKVLAAGWGYACTIEELQAKYSSLEMRQKVVEKIKTAKKVERVFYLSEMMVDEAVRKRGIAKTITKRLCGIAQSLDLNLVMRTRKDSPMVKIADKMQMSQLITVGEDTENPNRVLFIKSKAKPFGALPRAFFLLTIMSIMVVWVSTLINKEN